MKNVTGIPVAQAKIENRMPPEYFKSIVSTANAKTI